MNETITWNEGIPPTDEVVAVMCTNGWKAAWYDRSAGRWRDMKYMLLGDVTHWASIRGPR